jgi:Ulp1 family protease
MNIKNIHWAFVKIDLQTHTIYSVDGLYSENEQKERCEEVLDIISSISDKSMKLYKIEIIDCFKQFNSDDCGIYMLKELENNALHHSESFSLKGAIGDLRLIMALQLIEEKLYLI